MKNSQQHPEKSKQLEIWVKLNLIHKIWGYFTKPESSRLFNAQQQLVFKEWVRPEGRCCLQTSSVSCCRSGKGHRQEMAQGMVRRNSPCPSTKYRWIAHWVLSPFLPWRYQLHLRTCFILTFPMSTLKRSVATAGELMGRWTPLGLSVNSCFRLLTSACLRLDTPRCLTKENLEGEMVHQLSTIHT